MSSACFAYEWDLSADGGQHSDDSIFIKLPAALRQHPFDPGELQSGQHYVASIETSHLPLNGILLCSETTLWKCWVHESSQTCHTRLLQHGYLPHCEMGKSQAIFYILESIVIFFH